VTERYDIFSVGEVCALELVLMFSVGLTFGTKKYEKSVPFLGDIYTTSANSGSSSLHVLS